MPPPRRRTNGALSTYDREMLQAIADRRLDPTDPDAQAVLQRVNAQTAVTPPRQRNVTDYFDPLGTIARTVEENVFAPAATALSEASRPAVEAITPLAGAAVRGLGAEVSLNPQDWPTTTNRLEQYQEPYRGPIGTSPLDEGRPPVGPTTTAGQTLSALGAVLPWAYSRGSDLVTGQDHATPAPNIFTEGEQPTFKSVFEAHGYPGAVQDIGSIADLVADPIDLAFPVVGAGMGLIGTGLKVAKKAGGATARGTVARRLLETMREPDRALVAQEIAAQFPRVDAYTKLNRHLSRNMLDARLSSPEGLSPATQQFVRAIRESMDEPIAPLELQSLARGEDYVPGRRVRRGHTRSDTPDPVNAPSRARRYQGAPSDVATAAHERTRLNHYLALVREGEKGADWYDTSGAATLFAMGDDVPRAREMADVVAITSPATKVDVNTGFALQGVEQLESGIPVYTGRFPARDSAAVQALREGGEVTGQKRLPFSQQIQLGGGFSEVDSPRSVHDIWDMEAWGYQNADGTPLREAASTTQHRWMDSMTEKAIAKANRENLGGRSDWTTGHLQAAAWTGSKIRAGIIKPGADVVDIASAFNRREMQLSREAIPGRTAQHLEGLEGEPLEQYARDQFEIDTDPQGRSRLAIEGRVPVGTRSGEGTGVYQGETSPGYQASIVAGHSPAPGGGTEVFPPTMARATRIEGGYAWLHAQDAGAGSRLTEFPTEKEYNAILASEPDIYKQPMRGAELTLNRTPTADEMELADKIMTQAAGANDAVAVVFIPGKGIRLGNLPESKLNLKQFDRATRQVARALQAPRKNGRFSSFYIDNNWGEKTLGQEYWQYLPEPGSRAERELQRQTTLVRKRDATEAVRNPSVRTNPLIQEIRAVYEKGGLSAMQAFATKRGLPLTAVLAALGLGAQSQASDGGSRRRS